MKKVFFYLLAVTVTVSCYKSETSAKEKKYRARFEIYGICNNSTFSVIAGDIDPGMVEPKWTDPQTVKTYTNAFAISNMCGFNANLKQGDEFNFEIVDYDKVQLPCGTCGAYYPRPSKILSIKVVP